ncbi:MAG: TIGR00366 family protein [Bacteroidota bacterium]
MNNKKIVVFLEKYLPSPFSIAFLLTLISIILAFFFTKSPEESTFYFIDILGFWEKGFWELLSFTMQMSLILLLGHVLAISPIMKKLTSGITQYCTSTAKAAFIISFTAIFISYINWGMCLIIGAVFVREVGEYAIRNGIKISYPILGAAGYSGMMTWHGGFSGSAPLVVSQPGHFLESKMGVLPISETLLSPLNIVVFLSTIIIIPAFFYLIGKKTAAKHDISEYHFLIEKTDGSKLNSNEDSDSQNLDQKRWPALVLGLLVVLLSLIKAFESSSDSFLGFINLNYVNFLLFGLGILLHGSFKNFLKAVENAIHGISGIIIQFPLYAGIMGIMKYSGLVGVFSEAIVSISNTHTFPLLTLFSGALVNTFVPSGGGQWAVQGPILIEAANQLNVSTAKTVMALSYGDQLTNMLQPFWALPLLGITRLKAAQIFPYSLSVLLVGALIYSSLLLIF